MKSRKKPFIIIMSGLLLAVCILSACRHIKRGKTPAPSERTETQSAQTAPQTAAQAKTTAADRTEATEAADDSAAGVPAADKRSTEATSASAPVFDLGAFFAQLTDKSVKAADETQTEATAASAPVFDLGAFFAQLTKKPAATDVQNAAPAAAARDTEKAETKEEAPSASPPKVRSSAALSFPIYYEDAGVKITITKQWYVGAWCYIAHVQMSDYSRLKTGMARDAYGYDELPASFAARHDCLLTVNGDYAEGDRKGVLRAGNIYASSSAIVQGVYSRNTGQLSQGGGKTLSELVGMGYTDSFGFGAGDLVVDGKSVYLRKDGGKSTQRTLIGTTGTPGDIYIVVTEGRYCDGVSRGLQYYEAGDLLESLGCSFGIALDGGICSALVWDGCVLNRNPPQKTTGFVYITKR